MSLPTTLTADALGDASGSCNDALRGWARERSDGEAALLREALSSADGVRMFESLAQAADALMLEAGELRP